MRNSGVEWDDLRDISPRRFLCVVAPRMMPTGRGIGREDAAAFWLEIPAGCFSYFICISKQIQQKKEFTNSKLFRLINKSGEATFLLLKL